MVLEIQTTKKCRHCQKEMSLDASVCPYCRREQARIRDCLRHAPLLISFRILLVMIMSVVLAFV